MASIKLVDADKLTPNEDGVSDQYDNTMLAKFKQIYDKFGQIKPVVVAIVDGKVKVIDGNKKLMMLKQLGAEKILCSVLGKMTESDYASYRIAFNYHQPRIDYIGIATMIDRVTSNEHELTKISMQTGIPLEDVKRFKDLLTFDWDEFLKIDPTQQSQFTLFD